ncbi:MAG: cyclodeaminase/cyclohydrolase family protein [Oscillospiraceae bacterium]|nr:cyclodeaminase/cyclohydrolase family protein [Oscillospiraceae bacterium]
MQTGKYVVEDYLSELSSKAPVPGGGGVAALTGAMGVALASMVCSLTLGKKKYAPVEEEVRVLASKAEILRGLFLGLADDDAEAFLPLSAAYSMKRDTDAERKARDEVMQKALKAAADVPLQVLSRCREAVPIFEELLEKGSTLAVSDVGVGVLLIRAAAESASLNVMINTTLMKDGAKRDELNSKASELADEVAKKAGTVYELVGKKVGV